jgi:hypothetical protein
MTVAIPLTAPTTPSDTATAEAPHLPSLWELGAELRHESRWIAQLAERLDTDDEAERARAIADLEQGLAAEEHCREAFTRKADATCWVIGRLRAEATYHLGQSKRYGLLARSEESRADALEASLIRLLAASDPSATRFQLSDHHLTSRLSDAVEIDDPEALPAELVATHTSHTPDKASIKARIKAAIRSAISGLSHNEAPAVAFAVARSAVPGARLVQRRHWSIR